MIKPDLVYRTDNFFFFFFLKGTSEKMKPKAWVIFCSLIGSTSYFILKIKCLKVVIQSQHCSWPFWIPDVWRWRHLNIVSTFRHNIIVESTWRQCISTMSLPGFVLHLMLPLNTASWISWQTTLNSSNHFLSLHQEGCYDLIKIISRVFFI